MNLTPLKNDFSVRGKNGIPFLLSATFIWTIVSILFLTPLEIEQKNLFMLFSTGLMFPLAVIASKVIKADWKIDNNPLADLGLYLNIAQFMYFPIIFWAFAESPNHMVLLFAIITGAHLFPYGWVYHTKAYYIMAPVLSLAVTIVGWSQNVENLWYIPLTMLVLIILLIFFLYSDYKKKVKLEHDAITKEA